MKLQFKKITGGDYKKITTAIGYKPGTEFTYQELSIVSSELEVGLIKNKSVPFIIIKQRM